jgi:hypothetical protein
MMETGTIRIVAALIRDDAGRVLLVRKRGTAEPRPSCSPAASAIRAKTTPRRWRAIGALAHG